MKKIQVLIYGQWKTIDEFYTVESGLELFDVENISDIRLVDRDVEVEEVNATQVFNNDLLKDKLNEIIEVVNKLIKDK